jgi:hypothetical protein
MDYQTKEHSVTSYRAPAELSRCLAALFTVTCGPVACGAAHQPHPVSGTECETDPDRNASCETCLANPACGWCNSPDHTQQGCVDRLTPGASCGAGSNLITFIDLCESPESLADEEAWQSTRQSATVVCASTCGGSFTLITKTELTRCECDVEQPNDDDGTEYCGGPWTVSDIDYE